MVNKLTAYILAISGCLFFGTAGYAQTAPVPQSTGYEIIKPTFSFDSIKELLNNMSTVQGGEDDLLLASLLAIPFEKRQYAYPQLFENPGMPKKILSHPEIAIWKGKKPTTLPPQLKDFAAQYMAYLPASYYILLDPVYWQEKPYEKTDSGTINLPEKRWNLKLTPHKGEFYTFPTVRSLYKISPNTAANFKKTDLTKGDIDRLFTTINALKDFINAQPDPTQFNHSMISLMLRNNQIEKDLGDPFLSLVTRMKMLTSKQEMDDFFIKQGWQGSDDFVQKSDRILKAYRVNYLNPTIAIQLQKIRSYPKNAPQTETLKNLKAFARMHEAMPGDVYFVEPYLKEIRTNLKPDYILFMGTPIYME